MQFSSILNGSTVNFSSKKQRTGVTKGEFRWLLYLVDDHDLDVPIADSVRTVRALE